MFTTLVSRYPLAFSLFVDCYFTEHVFNLGFGSLGVFSLVAGFMRNKIALIVFRALMGIGKEFLIGYTVQWLTYRKVLP